MGQNQKLLVILGFETEMNKMACNDIQTIIPLSLIKRNTDNLKSGAEQESFCNFL